MTFNKGFEANQPLLQTQYKSSISDILYPLRDTCVVQSRVVGCRPQRVQVVGPPGGQGQGGRPGPGAPGLRCAGGGGVGGCEGGEEGAVVAEVGPSPPGVG